ncbi:chromosome segregation protein SMC [Planctobacterium marinum]|uniref:chromosome segregation protein SMC n=1 Tax=Planctobacterium marinum TaxID=1631968 RepID=UPI001E3D120F|nr:chromosome segregation protein SMC [Planctobacterium marinum]MCC2607314.1 chromosome segregation protein SMC [Planctobacterium marinum]
MRLNKIRLAGFKSFVDPTNIPFPDDMTAIVGPNGCGKSNVIDAVRWVLGESSAKNLRGDAMTDVIFNGSSSRKPVSQCSVELVFDNSSQRIQGEYAAFDEISVKRVVTRDAQSNYYLNGARCRRRDVTDLFLGTGLGPRSYAIIEQGMISRLIESKPQELRVFIEEAAGVSKYKERRRETENRIRHTRDNLDRLGDVRTELGQQLDKLQRQAAAAKRYTELKAKERAYKGQLAAIRWLKHSGKIADLEQQVQQQEANIEAYIAKQRGDEKEITELREQQQEVKQQIADIQHQFYLVGNEITRLEQNKIFRLQRESQLNEEINTAESLAEELSMGLEQAQEKSLILAEQLDALEPEAEILNEALMDAEEQLARLQDEWLEKQKNWRSADQQFTHLKQQAQNRHSRIQGLLQVQLRTEQRIKELHSELNQDLDPQLVSELEEALLRSEQLDETEHLAQQSCDSLVTRKAQSQAQLQTLRTEREAQHKQLSRLESQLESARIQYQRQFETAGEEQRWLEAQPDARPLWQTLQVEDGWQYAVETAGQQWRTAWLLSQEADNALPKGLPLFFSDRMSAEKRPASLAEKCLNKVVPHWLNNIFVVDDSEQAIQIRETLEPGYSVITQAGEWFGSDWRISGLDNRHESPLQQKSKIDLLDTQLLQQLDLTQQSDGSFSEQEAALESISIALKDAELVLQSTKLERQHLTQQIRLLENQQQQHLHKQGRIKEELAQQQAQLEEEKMQLEELAMEVEELEMQIAELEEGHGDIEQQRNQYEDKLANARMAVENTRTQQHSVALKLQDVRFQADANNNKLHTGNVEAQRNQEKLSRLKQELNELLEPGEGQQGKLDELLAQKQALADAQLQFNQQLQTLEEQLADAEKGQVGVQQQVEKMRAEAQSLQLEIERNRTRANTFVEQLQEMQQSLKQILEHLPDDCDEEVWRVELEKTTSALQKLGAVNLAAVDEYQVQSERKQHLDTQNDDLEAALETLENAIRKIDKETRTRFKETFEKVNEDVKMLFPKVFGGGAAWLELTGEDLLETGVTIMARPPGKKNSTIHLLSGGEKALTALSLVFAIFRLNPAPFCLLDEVDAPLDDANVGRFCKLVSEMSKTVQFIFITHNKIAMEMAYHLTGVTMAEPGVSRIVAVDVEEAVAIANA